MKSILIVGAIFFLSSSATIQVSKRYLGYSLNFGFPAVDEGPNSWLPRPLMNQALLFQEKSNFLTLQGKVSSRNSYGVGSSSSSNIPVKSYISKETDIDGRLLGTYQTVMEKDNISTITCPPNISVNNDPGKCGAVVNYELPTATNNCEGGLPTSVPGYTNYGTFEGHAYFLSNSPEIPENANNNAMAVGGHLVTIGSIAENGFVKEINSGRMWIGFTDRASEGTFQWITGEPVTFVRWVNGEPTNSPPDEDWTAINWTGQSSGDWNDLYYYVELPYVVEFEPAEPQITLVSGLTSGSFFPVGTTPVTYKVTDGCGNESTCTFTVTVIDTEAPVITCTDLVVNPTSLSGATVNYPTPIATDNCTVASVSILEGPSSGSTFPIGSTSVTYQLLDGNGNSNTCSFIVTIRDPYTTEKKISVCHKGSTLAVNANALKVHLDHGDNLGPCTWYTPAASTVAARRAEQTISNEKVEGSSKVKLHISPNPTFGILNVQLDNYKPGKAEVIIMGGNGGTLSRKSIQVETSSQVLRLDLGRRASGMYVVKVLSEEGVRTVKVVVQR